MMIWPVEEFIVKVHRGEEEKDSAGKDSSGCERGESPQMSPVGFGIIAHQYITQTHNHGCNADNQHGIRNHSLHPHSFTERSGGRVGIGWRRKAGDTTK